MPSGRRYYMLAVATLGFIVLGLSLFSYSTISVPFSKQFAVSDTASGLLTSAFALTYAIMQIPAGLISDRIGGARALVAAFSVTTLAPLLFIFGDGFGGALLSRAIAGIGAGMILPSSVRLLSAFFPEKELHRAMGILGTGWGGSQIIAYLVLPLLVFGQDWHPTLEFVVAFSLAVTVMAVLPTRWAPSRVSPAATATISARDVVTKRLLALSATNFTALLVPVGILAWMPAFLTGNLGLGAVDAGRLVAIFGVSGIASSFAGGVLSQRVGPRPVVLASMLMLVVAPYFIATSGSWPMALLWLAVLGVGGNLYFGPCFALVPYSSRYGPEAAGTSFGIFNTLSNVGTFISPLVIGYALEATGSYLVGFVALGAIGVVGVLGALLTRTLSSAQKPGA